MRSLVTAMLVTGITLIFLGCDRAPTGAPIPWQSSIPLGIEAAETGQPILVYFTATWCVPCRKMEAGPLQSASVTEAIKAFVPVKIDIDQQPKTAEAYFAEATPAFFILDQGGVVRARAVGYHTPEDLVAYLNESAALLADERADIP